MRGRRVIVAGAGLAGLAAAHELAAAGAAVTIVEARPRLGGRVWTTRDGFAAGQHGELGGEFIDEDHAQMRALAQRFGLPLVRVLRSGFTHRLRVGGEFQVRRTGAWDALADVLSPLITRYKAARGRVEAESVRELATYSLRGWLQREEAPPDVHAVADCLRGFFVADPEELSVLPVVAQLAESGSPAETPVYRLEGGADRLVDALAAATPARVLLRHRLARVNQAVDRIMAHVTDDDGRQQQIEADFIVVALPASTLRDVAIAPSLPEEQARAIRRLQYGRATKLVVQHRDTAFARRRARAFATDGALGAFWDSSEGQPDDARRDAHAVLTFLAGGSASERLRERIAHGASSVLSDLCWLGLAGAPVVTSASAVWHEDPFAGGAYAVLDPGFDPAWTPLLSRRAGRIVFAGEHTSEDFQGYMEGAVTSGARAARELMS